MKRTGDAAAIKAEPWLESLIDPRSRLGLPQIGFANCFDRWVVKPRTIPEHLAYLITGSAICGRINGHLFRLDPGMFVWVMPGVLHEFWIPDNAPRPSLFHLKLTLASRSGPPLRLIADSIHVGEGAGLRPYCEELAREVGSSVPFAGLRLRLMLAALFSAALRLSTNGAHDGPCLDSRQRASIAKFLHHRAAERVTPAQLARELHLNPEYFTRLFTRSYGVPPRTWIVRERMQVAARLLQEGSDQVSTISHQLGYPDVFLFSRQFKQTFGRSPTVFRRDQ